MPDIPSVNLDNINVLPEPVAPAKTLAPAAKKSRTDSPLSERGKTIQKVDRVVSELEARMLNIADTYNDWLNICFALASLGEDGRAYFHRVSQLSSKYKETEADDKFNSCLKREGRSGKISIATFFDLAKSAGVDISNNKLVNKAKEITIYNSENKDIIKINKELENIEYYLKENYNLKLNSITGFVEDNGRVIDEYEMNSIHIKILKHVDGRFRYETLARLLNSDFVPRFNPILDYFDTCLPIRETGHIVRLASAVVSDTGSDAPGGSQAYVLHFLRKYLVGIVAAAHGRAVPLVLVFTGNQNTGKTQFLRDLLPSSLKPYYAESKLDAGKDDEILMTQKLLIVDDEFGGKSKRDEKRLKELTSKSTFAVRRPYGRFTERLQRIAVLGGSTNDEQILNDPTGNRRIIPINILKLVFDELNNIDRNRLFSEAYHLYRDGFEWEIKAQDIARLNAATGAFEVPTSEGELISKYFALPGSIDAVGEPKKLTATDIKSELERLSGQKLYPKTLGQELKRLGFERNQKRVGRKSPHFYTVCYTTAYLGRPQSQGVTM